MKKYLPGVLSLTGLTAAYLAIRYPLLFLHGMKQWPFVLFAVGAVVIVLTGFVLKKRLLPILTLLGYTAGFFIGHYFQSDYGVGLNNLWTIWTAVFISAVFVGIIAEMFRKRRKAD